MPAHDRNRPGGPSSSSARTGARRAAAARLDRRLEHRLTVRSDNKLASMVDMDRKAAGHEEPARSAGPGYGHGV